MSEAIEYSKVISEVLQKNLETLVSSAVSLVKKLDATVRNKTHAAYSDYLDRTSKKVSHIKTLLYRDTPKYLYSFYVPLDLRREEKLYPNADFRVVTKSTTCSVIVGTAGIGKSTLMKHLYLDVLISKRTLPIFVELKALNNTSDDLITCIHGGMRTLGFTLEMEYLCKAMDHGVFSFFLDGFDEIDNRRRGRITQQLLEMVDHYPRNNFIVSSRPDVEFLSWGQFAEYTAEPLSEDKACMLIRKLEYDPEVKTKFAKKLKDSLYKKHTSFLSIPLLLTIMLMTYEQYADIPPKMHLFYQEAFDTLYTKHDATKSQYKRRMYTKLARDDFKRVLAAFCVLTFVQHQTTFTRAGALSALAQAKRLVVTPDFNNDDYLNDLLQSVCVLMEDGLHLVFTHKSFQEYYAAVFIASAEQQLQLRLLKEVCRNFEVTQVLVLLHEIEPGLVEDKILIPQLEKLRAAIGDGQQDEVACRPIKYHVKSLHAVEDSVTLGGYIDIETFLEFVVAAYPKPLRKVAWSFKRKEAFRSGALSECVREINPDGALRIARLESKSPLMQAMMSYKSIAPIEEYERAMCILKYLIEKRNSKRASIAELLFGDRARNPESVSDE